MSFVDQSRKPSPASMAAVIGVHAAAAGLLVTGLTVTGALPEIVNPIEARNIPNVPPPPPPSPTLDTPKATPKTPVDPPVFVPQPKFELNPIQPRIDTTELLPPPLPPIQPGRELGIEVPKPSPAPSFDPVGAKPRNDPARWLSDRDYRPSWSRRELTGLAKFRLEIAANGTVTNCTVTGSTGHSELDNATCRLVSQRAKFEPARGSNGEPIAGSYNGAVMWTLPD